MTSDDRFLVGMGVLLALAAVLMIVIVRGSW